jgi:hypothetical protein
MLAATTSSGVIVQPKVGSALTGAKIDHGLASSWTQSDALRLGQTTSPRLARAIENRHDLRFSGMLAALNSGRDRTRMVTERGM